MKHLTYILTVLINMTFVIQSLAAAPPPLAALHQAHELKVVTFNTWLLEIFGIDGADDLIPRRELMVTAFNEMNADVLSLREVWPAKHRKFLVDNLSDKYPYCSFDTTPSTHSRRTIITSTTSTLTANAGIIDGLMIFSKFPIGYPNQAKDDLGCVKPTHTLRFSENTDRFDEETVHKGAIHIVIHHPTLGPIDVYNSHFDALSLNEEVRDYQASHKATSSIQANEFIEFVMQTKSHQHQILAIDVNQHFRQWDANGSESDQINENYQMLISELNAVDTFMMANNYNPQTLTGVYTFDTRNNTYASDSDDLNRRSFESPTTFIVEGTRQFIPSTMLDYIWYIGDGLASSASSLIFTEPVQMYANSDERKHLSNHYGVISTLSLFP